MKLEKLADARDVTRRKKAGKYSRHCLCAIEIDCRALFRATHEIFPLIRRSKARKVLFVLPFLKKLGFQPLAPWYQVVIAASRRVLWRVTFTVVL